MIDAGAQPSILFSGTQGPEYRTSHSCHMDRADPLVSTITERICALMGVEPRFTETLQGQRYTPGQEYKPHWDYFPLNDTYWPDMREMGGQRTWTAMLYCSDVEAGGETQFVSSTLSVTPAEGALLLWNNMGKDGAPNTDSAHYARPVEAGVKYVLTLWFRERPWL
jgi:prolyl 4-hydroxylase